MTVQEAMVSCWQRRVGESGDQAVHPMYEEAFAAAWEECQKECFVAVLIEKIRLDNVNYNSVFDLAIEAINNV